MLASALMRRHPRIRKARNCRPFHSGPRSYGRLKRAPAGAQTEVCATMRRMTLVEATYELQKPLAEEELRALGTFANTYGLRRFRINDKNHLSFEYDASRLRGTEVEHVLRHLNIAVTKKVN